VSKLPIWLSM